MIHNNCLKKPEREGEGKGDRSVEGQVGLEHVECLCEPLSLRCVHRVYMCYIYMDENLFLLSSVKHPLSVKLVGKECF